MGCEGALLCGPAGLTDYLVNHGRGFIFSTAPSPLMAAVARAAILLLGADGGRQAALQALIGETGALFRDRLSVAPTGSQIIPVIIGDNKRAMQVAARLQAAGFDVRGIRPPTVPEGTARLRVSLTLNVDGEQVAALVGAIEQALAA
jgi:8-amino-7-oxononanoate synthase